MLIKQMFENLQKYRKKNLQFLYLHHLGTDRPINIFYSMYTFIFSVYKKKKVCLSVLQYWNPIESYNASTHTV